MMLARTLLNIYFENELKCFQIEDITHHAYPLTYATPNFIINAIHDEIKELSDKQIEEIMTTVHKQSQSTSDTFIIDKHLPEMFKTIVESKEFRTRLHNYIIKHPPLDSYVFDKTTGHMYKAKHAHHYDAILSIMALHPELKTIENQDAFILNQLILAGQSKGITWYQPTFLAKHSEQDLLEQYDVDATFNKIYSDILKANETRPEDDKQHYYLVVDNHQTKRPKIIITQDKERVIKTLIDYNLADEIIEYIDEYEFLTTSFLDELKLAQTYRQPLYNNSEIIDFKMTNGYDHTKFHKLALFKRIHPERTPIND